MMKRIQFLRNLAAAAGLLITGKAAAAQAPREAERSTRPNPAEFWNNPPEPEQIRGPHGELLGFMRIQATQLQLHHGEMAMKLTGWRTLGSYPGRMTTIESDELWARMDWKDIDRKVDQLREALLSFRVDQQASPLIKSVRSVQIFPGDIKPGDPLLTP
jgi:hypothetical protein